MIQIKARIYGRLDKKTMQKNHLFRDVALVTAVKVLIIAAAGWLVFGQPLNFDAGSVAARLIGTPSFSPRGIAP